MDNIGAEVGQKMRSAIKAKLMELGCYVDDELPDYIMVMVANKRTKSQMNEDLQLFLTEQTSAFVDWLQIVLKKLKEITVTNPDIYKKVSKRKLDDSPKIPQKLKKEKKNKSKTSKKLKKKEPMKPIIQDIPQIKSLTDDLPVQASKLSEMRKIVIMQENHNSNSISNIENVNEDSFDIPPLSEVAMSNETELAEIEKKIRNVKSRLGLQIPSDSEDEDFINIKAEPDELFPNEQVDDTQKSDEKNSDSRRIQIVRSESIEEQPEELLTRNPSPKPRNEHPRIIFANETAGPAKRQSVLERLGKRSCDENNTTNLQKKTKISLINIRREEEEILGLTRPNNEEHSAKNNSKSEREEKHSKKDEIDDPKRTVMREAPRESALKRLGVMSKVAVPQKESADSDTEEVINKEVPSAVRVKPRILPPANNQANKNLLLKAVAEAQRSIAQTPIVGANKKPDALFTKKYREKITTKNSTSSKRLLAKDKNKIKTILSSKMKKDNKKELDFSSDDDNLEYVPKPIKKPLTSNEQLEYIPSVKDQSFIDPHNYIDISPAEFEADYSTAPKESRNQTFIITLDGIERRQSEPLTSQMKPAISEYKPKISDETNRKKSPSPIIFNAAPSMVNPKLKQIPDKLPVIYPLTSLKMKEKCKYWPGCRQGDKCEFLHPNSTCKAFPQCKFGDKCLYTHPMCKFENSCTRKDCPYSHSPRIFHIAPTSSLQMCKYFPNCNNIHCMFYHPKPCKYGRYCKNQAECNFSHGFPSKNNFTWRSSIDL